jgi:hypothetical protein
VIARRLPRNYQGLNYITVSLGKGEPWIGNPVGDMEKLKWFQLPVTT